MTAPRRAKSSTTGDKPRSTRRSRRTTTGSARGKAKGKRRSAKRGWLRRVVTWCVIALIWGGVISGGVLAFYAYDLPDVDAVEGISRAPNVTLLSSEGEVMASYGGRYGEPVVLADLPPDLPRAVIAVEDRRFYRHFGIDLRGLARAFYRNMRAGTVVEGGSTITQQLAKNLFLKPERTIKRKVQELLLSLWLERRFTKDQILTIYLNRVYLGAGAYGVDAAARRYFGKPATEVSLYEAAMIAGLLKAPSKLNPLSSAQEADARAGLVLAAMRDVGFIDEARMKAALAAKTRAGPPSNGGAPYFADWIMAQLQGFMGEVNRDLQIHTTLDPRLQRIAEEEIRRALEAEGQARSADQTAMVILDRDGAVRAMIGGADYRQSQFNRATQALRQPGSAFKPFVYLTALETGQFTPDSRVLDAPVEIAGWRPGNFGDKYYGEVTLRESFARSLNSVAVRLVQSVGPRRVAKAAERLGVTSELAPNGSIALGASEVTLLDLTGAYAAFSNDGLGVWPYGIKEIRSGSGEVFYRRLEGSGPGRVIEATRARQVTDMMRAVVAWGSGKAANPGRPAAGKTGTSQNFRDAWFIGFSSGLVGGVWFGKDDNSPMDGVTGGSLPARVWGRVMSRALIDEPPEPLMPPAVMVEATPPPEAEGDGFLSRLLTRLTGEEGATASDAASNQEERLERLFQRHEDRR
jgi:penicillin-binding protein 1A